MKVHQCKHLEREGRYLQVIQETSSRRWVLRHNEGGSFLRDESDPVYMGRVYFCPGCGANTATLAWKTDIPGVFRFPDHEDHVHYLTS